MPSLQNLALGRQVGLVVCQAMDGLYGAHHMQVWATVRMPPELYDCLHFVDEKGVDAVIVEPTIGMALAGDHGPTSTGECHRSSGQASTCDVESRAFVPAETKARVQDNTRFSLCPQRDLNPCRRRERPVSRANQTMGHISKELWAGGDSNARPMD